MCYVLYSLKIFKVEKFRGFRRLYIDNENFIPWKI